MAKTDAFRIYKRPFNPSHPEGKNVRILVASFTKSGEVEARLMLQHLQHLATGFTLGNAEVARFRYTLWEAPPPVKNRFADLEIDATTARTTNRPIRYELNWDVKHGKCLIMAYTKLHGTVRAEIENDAEARNVFKRKLKQVWPNAEMSRK